MAHNLDRSTVPLIEDDISILSTPYVPDIETANAIKSRLQFREEEIHALDKKIQELCAHRATLRQMNTVAQGLVAPIRKVPPEIMAEIFVLSIPTVYPSRFKTHRVGFENRTRGMRQCLGRVCRGWRDILHDTPQAWAGLVLDGPISEDLSDIQRLLQKSGACPLDIYIKPSTWSDGSFAAECYVHIHAMMPLLRGKAERFHSFYGDLWDTHAEFYLQELFRYGEISGAPIPEIIGNIGQVVTSKLQSFDIQGPSDPLRLSPFLSLRRLGLKLHGSSQIIGALYLPILVHCPQLEAFQLVHCFCDGAPDPPITPPGLSGIKVYLLSLKKLSLMAFRVSDAQDFLHSLQISLLDTVYLDLAGIYHTVVARVFIDCLAPAAVSLLHLTLRNVHLTIKDKQWLSRLTNLRFLRIGGQESNLDKTIVSALTHRPSPLFDLCACPKLERLVFEHVRVPGKELLCLARRRIQPDGEAPLPGYFSRLEVYHCFGMQQVHEEKLLHMNRASLQLTNKTWDAWGPGCGSEAPCGWTMWEGKVNTAACWEDAEEQRGA